MGAKIDFSVLFGKHVLVADTRTRRIGEGIAQKGTNGAVCLINNVPIYTYQIRQVYAPEGRQAQLVINPQHYHSLLASLKRTA